MLAKKVFNLSTCFCKSTWFVFFLHNNISITAAQKIQDFLVDVAYYSSRNVHNHASKKTKSRKEDNQAQGSQEANQAQGCKEDDQAQGSQEDDQAKSRKEDNQAQGCKEANQAQGCKEDDQAQDNSSQEVVVTCSLENYTNPPRAGLCVELSHN